MVGYVKSLNKKTFTKYFLSIFQQKPIFFASCICAVFFYFFNFPVDSKNSLYSFINSKEISIISGKLISSPVKTSNQKYYSAKLKIINVGNKVFTCQAKGITTIYIPTELVEAYLPGKLYSLALPISTEQVFLFENGGIYTFGGKFKNKVFFCSDCKDSKWDKNIKSKISFFRAVCRLQFKRMMFAWGKAGGLLLALLCGSKEYIHIELSDAFRKAGLAHILALSGMHLSMFSNIAIKIGSKVKNKKVSYFLRFLVISLFVWFAGFSPSLLRAYICSLLLITASILGIKQPDMLIILCSSFLLQCVFSPDDIKNLGFMLSYTALAGILLFSKLINLFLLKIIPAFLSDSLSSSIAAQIFTAPISLSYFNSFSPIGIIATTIISPIISFFIYIGLLLIICTFIFPNLLSTSGIFMNFLYTIIEKLVNLFSHFPRIQF